MPESEAMVIPKGKHAAVAVMMEAGAGVIVGLEQIGLEKLDADRMVQGNLKDALQWEAAQNVVPLAQSAVAIILAMVPKGKTLRRIGSALIAPSVTMATYRAAKFVPTRISVTAQRMTNNNRSIADARRNNNSKSTPPAPGKALQWTPSGITA